MIKINNKANLPFEIIGKVFDNFITISPYTGDSTEYELFDYKRKEYKMTIEYKITQINITVEELDIVAKDISKKGLRFPKLK